MGTHALDDDTAAKVEALRARAETAGEDGRYEDAIRHYESVLELHPTDFDALVAVADLYAECGGRRDRSADACYARALAVHPGSSLVADKRDRLYRQRVPDWHWRMMNDEDRNGAFAEAIAAAVTPTSIVLDIGCGSGLLAMMAARAGARHVYTVEMVGTVADVAQEIVANHGYGDRVTVVAPFLSREIDVGIELPERADVLTVELLGNDPLSENILPVMRDARRRLLKPDARLIPCRVVVMGMLVESREAHRLGSVGTVAGFDLSPFNRLWGRRDLADLIYNYEHRPLSEPFEVFSFDLTADPERERDEVMLRVAPTVDGTCHLVVWWQRIYTTPDRYIETYEPHPATDCPSWLQKFEICVEPVPVRAGSPVRVRGRHELSHVAVELMGD